MNLATNYLGLELQHPLMVGASPLSDDLDQVRRLEDAGSSAIVMHSLFEEQIELEQVASMHVFDAAMDAHPEATSYLPSADTFVLGPDEYVEQVRRIRECVSVPVIASLNGTHAGRWLNYAVAIEQAGASAIELNNYQIAADPGFTGAQIEDELVSMVRNLKRRVTIPIAVKLAPFYSSLANLATRLDEAGADGLILFNRFLLPDVDPEELSVQRALHLSRPDELPLRLTWLALLYERTRASLAATGGVHSGQDVVKAVVCGADVVQMVSRILSRGAEEVGTILQQFTQWLEEHEYESLDDLRGALSVDRCPDPDAYRRVNYIRILQSWQSENGDRLPPRGGAGSASD